MAEAMKLSPSPTPTTSGHSLRAPTSTSGLVGGHRDERVVAAQVVVGEADGLDQVAVEVRAIRWATTSASVSEVNSAPSASSRSRSSVQFSTIPLSTMWTRSELSECGWALASVTRPWVAQRVWPIPVEPLQVARSSRATASRRCCRLPTACTLPIGAVVTQREARGVVPAVLEPLQPCKQEVAAFARPDVSDDAAHATSRLMQSLTRPSRSPAPMVQPSRLDQRPVARNLLHSRRRRLDHHATSGSVPGRAHQHPAAALESDC